MERYHIPRYAKRVLERLESAGHHAVLVGGCVRDMLRGKRPRDFDVATSAVPGQVRALFARTLPTGLKYGTVSVLSEGKWLEVTTFRAEGAYQDARRPDEVRFGCGLEADLSRRDFTINAVAMFSDGHIADPFSGVADIENGLIRCVGDPRARFEEDALRMVRAVRFMAATEFEIEPKTRAAMVQMAPLAARLSGERVNKELCGILLSVRPDCVDLALKVGLLGAYTDKVNLGGMSLDRLPRKLPERLSGLCAALFEDAEACGAFLQALKLDRTTASGVLSGLREGRNPPPTTGVEWKRLLSCAGGPAVRCAAAVWDVRHGGAHIKAHGRVLRSGECWSLAALAVSGRDLISAGAATGEQTGQALGFLLEHVIEHPEDNDARTLMGIYASYKEKG